MAYYILRHKPKPQIRICRVSDLISIKIYIFLGLLTLVSGMLSSLSSPENGEVKATWYRGSRFLLYKHKNTAVTVEQIT